MLLLSELDWLERDAGEELLVGLLGDSFSLSLDEVELDELLVEEVAEETEERLLDELVEEELLDGEVELLVLLDGEESEDREDWLDGVLSLLLLLRPWSQSVLEMLTISIVQPLPLVSHAPIASGGQG